MRNQIVAGNWKMNKDWNQGLALVEEIKQLLSNHSLAGKVVISPPYIHLARIAEMIGPVQGLFLAAQNCHQEASGAYTGEISASMLKSIGVDYVILGHSERREYFKESHEVLALKVQAVLEQNMIPIFCCGEPLEVREANQQNAYVNQQLTDSLFQLEADSIQAVVIAYEPIWAIGTGRTASSAQAQEMHASIRQHFSQKYGDKVAQDLTILYGGSCKPGNAKEIFEGPDVDGGLIGGASLNSSDFIAIANSL